LTHPGARRRTRTAAADRGEDPVGRRPHEGG
jgi:hypothetical protein